MSLGCERSCSIARKFQYQRTSGGGGGIYPHIKLYCNVLGIDNVMGI